VPTYAAQVSTAKIHLIQSIISRLLVTAVFDSYFVGLPDDRASELRNVEQYLGSMARDMTCSNQWRSSRLAAFKKEALEKLQPAADSLVTTLVSRINNILNNISDVQHSDARDQSLRSLLNSAVELSRLLRVQKAVFKTIMPVIEGHQINIFDADTMEDVGGEDEDSLEGREICCTTFPGMIKEGDEAGEHAQLKNVISKARILCSPG
jgi:activating signal cointegrator complex subunit 1